MRAVEEEWTEQVLTFSNYKRRGPVLLVKEDSERLLEQLEDAQALLANMLTSKHIGSDLCAEIDALDRCLMFNRLLRDCLR